MDGILDEKLIETTYLFCLKRISDENDALDLSQDILCAAAAAINDGKSFTDFYGWYWKMAKNKYADFIRKKSKTELPLDDDAAAVAASEPDRELIEKERLSEMNWSLSRLASLQREMMVRFYLKEESVREIAEALGIPVGTVKYRLFGARREVRERIDKMKSCGQGSYAPAEITLTFGGDATVTSRVLSGKIAQQAMVLCRGGGAKINDIADEMGVAPLYLEPILDEMKEAGLLKKLGEKYAANCGVYPLGIYNEASYESYRIFREKNYPEKITDALEGLKGKITSLDFYGNDFEYSYLMWILYDLACRAFEITGKKAYVKKFGGKYPDEAERTSCLTVRYLFPQEKLEQHKLRGMATSRMRSDYDTPDSVLEYINSFDAPPFPADVTWYRTERNTWVDANNITLLEALIENPAKKLSSYEEWQAAKLIEHGLIEKRGEELRVMLPLTDKEIYDEMTSLVSEALRAYAEEYSAAVAQAVERLLLPYVRPDLMSNFIHWDMERFFSPSCYLYYYGINETDSLFKPADYSRSAAALYIVRKKRR